MIEIRFHGRGGQGAVTAAALLAKAAGYDNKFSQGFPAFGVERRGAPVKAFTRIYDQPITIRSQVYKPDYIVILDPSLAGLPEVKEGLKPESVIVINAKEVNPGFEQKTHFYDATSLALKILGRDIVNTAMLGVFAKATKLVSMESVQRAIDDTFGGKVGELNKGLVKQAYDETKGDE
ncbi:MAG: pyruvate ferredoxin oxidoreductase subunit gamma [Candidatus Aenigmarchaeota archaeon]|nr:pyruvate ferredoxin oxidoreductase subunit gamma [Candidatus Aenigmarchaeota archaeon]